jgi:hypothetical protein
MNDDVSLGSRRTSAVERPFIYHHALHASPFAAPSVQPYRIARSFTSTADQEEPKRNAVTHAAVRYRVGQSQPAETTSIEANVERAPVEYPVADWLESLAIRPRNPFLMVTTKERRSDGIWIASIDGPHLVAQGSTDRKAIEQLFQSLYLLAWTYKRNAGKQREKNPREFSQLRKLFSGLDEEDLEYYDWISDVSFMSSKDLTMLEAYGSVMPDLFEALGSTVAFLKQIDQVTSIDLELRLPEDSELIIMWIRTSAPRDEWKNLKQSVLEWWMEKYRRFDRFVLLAVL